MSAQTPIENPPVGAPPPPPPPKRRHLKWWHWALIALGAFLALIIVIMVATSGGGGTTTQSTTQQPQATQAPTQAPAPTAAPTQAPTVAPTQAPTVAPAQPKVVLQTSGNGIKTTENFTVSGQWQIEYTLQPSDYAILQIAVYSADNNQIVDFVQLTAPGSDKTIMHQGGTYYLKVNAASAWSLTVTDLPN